MAYIFESENVASVKFDKNKNSEEITISGINGKEQDANVIINGLTLLFKIGGIEDRYNPTAAIRTVKQDVREN